ncbi:MAG: nucleoside kinase [Spirochaetia bacterium]|jgi:uridine kinase|nr:nucleoside kinase [Spirochaetia bacterium]
MKEVNIKLESGEKQTISYGTRVKEILSKLLSEKTENPVIAARINNELVSLSFKIEINSDVEPVRLYSTPGIRLFRRTLSFILAKASVTLFPERHLVISHSLGDSYYYYYNGQEGITDKDIALLQNEMLRIVETGSDIERRVISYNEALNFFKKVNQPATALLLKYRNESKIPIYYCGGFIDISYEPLLPNTALLKPFEIYNYAPGFLLRYPNRKEPQKLAPFKDFPSLFAVYKEYKAWGKILNVNCLGKLNELSENREIKPFIRVAEALHNKKISQIADNIAEKREHVRAILVAGPSSSGKTTFTKKLSIQLRVMGFNPVSISLDNYYLPNVDAPVDEHGKPDFEVLYSLNIELLNKHLLQLFEGKEVEIPIFDFITGLPKESGTPLQLTKRNILLIEGIHGLNPGLTPQVKDDLKYNIYISALTQLNLDDHNRIPTTDNRLIRRMVRDHQFRGNSAEITLNMWPSVRRGEEKNIFRFQDQADSVFNSALDYELAVLKIYATPILRTIKPENEVYNEAIRLLSFLDNFSSIPPQHVPDDSILREFIGESAFSY